MLLDKLFTNHVVFCLRVSAIFVVALAFAIPHIANADSHLRECAVSLLAPKTNLKNCDFGGANLEGIDMERTNLDEDKSAETVGFKLVGVWVAD